MSALTDACRAYGLDGEEASAFLAAADECPACRRVDFDATDLVEWLAAHGSRAARAVASRRAQGLDDYADPVTARRAAQAMRT